MRFPMSKEPTMTDNPFVDEDDQIKMKERRKVPFKQVLFGFQQLANNDIPQHEKLLKDGLSELKKQTARQKGQAQIREALKMLQRDLQQIAKMKHNVLDVDQDEFSNVTNPVCEEIRELILSTKKTILSTYNQEEASVEEEQETNESQKLITHKPKLDVLNVEEQLLIEETEELKRNADALKEITDQMQALQEIMNAINYHIGEQSEYTDRIENHIGNTDVNVQRSESILAQARSYKTAVLPAVGLTVGFAAGGPIGAMAGFRIGLASSIIGGALGYTGGKMIHQFNRLKFFPRIPQID